MRSLLARLILIFVVSFCAAASLQAQTVTFTGSVTDRNTGQAISGVAIVASGNQTGTRVAISDAQGNYSLQLGANTDIFLRAYKSGFIFSPLSSEFLSLGGFPLVGTFTGCTP